MKSLDRMLKANRATSPPPRRCFLRERRDVSVAHPLLSGQ